MSSIEIPTSLRQMVAQIQAEWDTIQQANSCSQRVSRASATAVITDSLVQLLGQRLSQFIANTVTFTADQPSAAQPPHDAEADAVYEEIEQLEAELAEVQQRVLAARKAVPALLRESASAALTDAVKAASYVCHAELAQAGYPLARAPNAIHCSPHRSKRAALVSQHSAASPDEGAPAEHSDDADSDATLGDLIQAAKFASKRLQDAAASTQQSAAAAATAQRKAETTLQAVRAALRCVRGNHAATLRTHTHRHALLTTTGAHGYFWLCPAAWPC